MITLTHVTLKTRQVILQDVDFTFEDFSMPEEFNILSGME